MDFKKVFRSKKGKVIPLLGGIIGVLLILFGGVFSFEDSSHGQNPSDTYYEVGFYTEALEERIEKLCLAIGGITEARVLLTLDCSTEYIYGQSIQQSGAGENISYSTDYIILNQNENDCPALVMEIYPKIRGIAVVCTGGENIQTKQKIIELLSAALGVPSNRIKVAGT